MNKNENIYYIDAYSKRAPYIFTGFTISKRKYENSNIFYTLKATGTKEKNKIQKICRHNHIRYKTYEKRWSRSGNYRDVFFRTHKPPYRCVYCGKYLNPKYMQIDHLIPVGKAKTDRLVQFYLKRKGITNINDPRNLVASCSKCNHRKSNKMGIWYIKGILGQIKGYFLFRKIIYNILCLSFMLLVILFIYIFIKLRGF